MQLKAYVALIICYYQSQHDEHITTPFFIFIFFFKKKKKRQQCNDYAAKKAHSSNAGPALVSTVNDFALKVIRIILCKMNSSLIVKLGLGNMISNITIN